MAELKMSGGVPTPSRPTLERREQALERLLLVAVTLLPEAPVGDAADLVSEAAFWLDYVPRGARAPYTSPELRLGARQVEARRALFEDGLAEDGALVTRKPGAPPKAASPRVRKARTPKVTVPTAAETAAEGGF